MSARHEEKRGSIVLQEVKPMRTTRNQFHGKMRSRAHSKPCLIATFLLRFQHVMHRGWAYFHARLAFTMAAFNVLVQWHGFQPYASGFVPLSIAEFSL